MSKHDEYVKYIQQMVESVCPYQNESQRRLYHAGFLASYLASQLEKDPFLLREFKKNIERIKAERK
jgi:hypothetical protein